MLRMEDIIADAMKQYVGQPLNRDTLDDMESYISNLVGADTKVSVLPDGRVQATVDFDNAEPPYVGVISP